jgi:hypothetical protein
MLSNQRLLASRSLPLASSSRVILPLEPHYACLQLGHATNQRALEVLRDPRHRLVRLGVVSEMAAAAVEHSVAEGDFEKLMLEYSTAAAEEVTAKEPFPHTRVGCFLRK